MRPVPASLSSRKPSARQNHMKEKVAEDHPNMVNNRDSGRLGSPKYLLHVKFVILKQRLISDDPVNVLRTFEVQP